MKVAVEDAFGNVVTSDTSTVDRSPSPVGPGGFAAGSTTSVAAVSGVATFSNLVLDTAGSYTLSRQRRRSDRRHHGQHHRQSGRGQPVGVAADADDRDRRPGA